MQDKGKENSFKVILNSAGLSNIYIQKTLHTGQETQYSDLFCHPEAAQSSSALTVKPFMD